MDIDRETIRERKDVCAGCGSPLRKVGSLEGDRRGDVFECSKHGCGYTEHRLYGDRYYETRK
ncbi:MULTISPECIES: hypothetical protein [Natrialbaceae]|uniref:hypothetical protein n=1 Tax=Natrialbaceae TaxID=1644061 RepID=UPI00207C80FA|nr:hypothetical protein [Natronococcus sp. CG52]